MITELLESLKYVGHYFAVCFLRVYVGIHIFNLGWLKYQSNYLSEPQLAAQINEFLKLGSHPALIEYFYIELVRPYWSLFSQVQLSLEIATGLLLIFGFLVRPAVILLLIYFWFFSYIQDPILWPWIGVMSAVLFSLGWAGAGRCLGVDYYFYKRYRGFLW
jgi:thiosulfate dehydrogenase [quinone] large subunit